MGPEERVNTISREFLGFTDCDQNLVIPAKLCKNNGLSYPLQTH
jgi:hypothetical protein